MSDPTETSADFPTGAPQRSTEHDLAAEDLGTRVKELLHEGNVRRIVVKNEAGHTVLEVPVVAGVLAAVIAPVLTAVGAMAALASRWQIEVHREPAPDDAPSAT